MIIYFAVSDPYSSPNPYVSTLIDALKRNHNDVKFLWGLDLFWNSNNFRPDIIHIHWPEFFCKWEIPHTSYELENKIFEYKEKGVKIVSTCHNLEAHYDRDNNVQLCYNIVYKNSDIIFHLGTSSLELFEIKYPESHQVLIHHHIYDERYCFWPSRDDSIKKLYLNRKKHYILCFGAFRNIEERRLVINIAKKIKDRTVGILAPNFIECKCDRKKEFFKYLWSIIKLQYYKYRFGIISTGKTFFAVEDDLLPYYYSVSDIAFIQRLKILNSGNVSMAFLMKKVVVGPNVGNVGLLLNAYRNPTFEINDIDSVINAINKGFELAKNGHGQKNYELASSQLSTKIVSDRIYRCYSNLSKNEI